MSRQEVVTLRSAGKQLIGVLQTAPTPFTKGVVFCHGWSGYRVGPHGMFVNFARLLATEGIPSLRFDFRGRGDSEGSVEEASLITMSEDTAAAVEWFVQRTGVAEVFLVGICSGAEVAFASATAHPHIVGLVLWSAPIFWAEAAAEEGVDSGRVERKKKAHYAKEYLRKLFQPQTWRKLFSGAIQFRLIAQVLLGRQKSTTTIHGVVTPQQWRAEMIERFAKFQGRVLATYGTNDPTTEDALPWYQSLCHERGIPFVYHLIQGANHSYYSLEWEREVMEKTLSWLKET